MAGLVGLTTALIQGPDSKKLPLASLTPVDERANPLRSMEVVLQFYPDTVDDSIQINYIDKDIPGLSHPLKQWVSNGGRTISFETVISRDIMPKEDLPFLVGLIVNPQSNENKGWNFDIRKYVKLLRAMCYPTYSELAEGVSVARAPRTLLLSLENMRLGRKDSDEVYALMTVCDVTYEAAFENGVPRRARIRLEFAEVIQQGTDILSWDGDVDFDYTGAEGQ